MSAIHIHLKAIAPPTNITLYSVFTADVTHSLVDGRSGFKKISFISTITPGHDEYVMIASLIQHEDEATFLNELKFLLELDPTLKNREVIFLVDGDRGRINAILNLLPWHKQENVKTHFNPVLNSLNKNTGMKLKDIREKLKS